MVQKCCHTCCLTPYAVSCLDMYITFRALGCPHDAVYHLEADAKQEFFQFLPWNCVCCSVFINVVPMWVYNPHVYNLKAMDWYIFSICVAKLTKIWERFMYRQWRSLHGHLVVQLLKLPKCQPTLISTARTIISDYCPKIIFRFTSLTISTDCQSADFGYQGSRKSWPFRY